MMSATIRRKALSLCSSALANNAFGRGSKLVPEIHQAVPFYSNPLRDVKTEFSTPKWIRSFSSHTESGIGAHISEPVSQVQANQVRAQNGPGYFTASGAVVGSLLSTPIVNAPQAAKLGLGATATSTFLPNLATFWHINNGIEEILADYVHHEMTRSLVLVLMRLFLIVAAKDVFVATN